MAKARSKSAGTRLRVTLSALFEIPADRLWGAQTERSLQNFRIGAERMPIKIVHALGIIKRAAAEVNRNLGRSTASVRLPSLPSLRTSLTASWTSTFPFGMANRIGHADQHERQRSDRQRRQSQARRHAWRKVADPSERPCKHEPVVERLDPDGHAHRSSDGDRATPQAALAHLHKALDKKAREFANIVKIGRTHTMDATPITLGQEFSGYAAQVKSSLMRLTQAQRELYPLAQGGTAVGTESIQSLNLRRPWLVASRG